MFRLVGGSIGTAVLGSLFAAYAGGGLHGLTPDRLAALAPDAQAAYAKTITEAIATVFRVAAVVTAAAADGAKRFVYDIRIDPDRSPAPVSSMSEIVGAFGLLEVDLSEHVYSYEN